MPDLDNAEAFLRDCESSPLAPHCIPMRTFGHESGILS